MKKRVALPTSGDNQIETLDFCSTVLIVDIEGGNAVRYERRTLSCAMPSLKVPFLVNCAVELVLCGAISDQLAMMLWHTGIEVVCGLRGDAMEVCNAYLRNDLARFYTPDFCGAFARGRRGCGRGRRFRGGRAR